MSFNCLITQILHEIKFVFTIEIFLWVDSVNYNVHVFFLLQNYTKCIEYRVVGVHLQWVEPVPYVPSQNSRLVPCHVDPGLGRLVTLRIMVSTKRCGRFVYHLCPCNCVIKQYTCIYYQVKFKEKNERSQVGLHRIASDGKLQAYTLLYKEIKEKN